MFIFVQRNNRGNKMSWFHKMFGICEHKWVTFQKVNHTWDDGSYYYTEYRQECEKCGDIKSVKLNKPFLF